MIGYIHRVISEALAPRARLRIPLNLWRSMTGEIYRRGGERTEAGCFILGKVENGVRVARAVIYYDDLDPDAYSTGAVQLKGRAFGTLWAQCKSLNMSVISDVHSHPGLAIQSPIDRQHPAVAHAGHVAMILPNFARGMSTMNGIGVYEYLGEHRWRTIDDVYDYLKVAWWV